MGLRSRGLFFLSLGIWYLQLFLVASVALNSNVRVKRQSGTDSLLTVEWEGIQTGDHADSEVKGFLVEYRPERSGEWQLHPGIIPYKGPNHQYRVQIPKLPTGISYLVRIKVIGENNEVLVETPEIRAHNEIVSIKCENDDLTAPRYPQVTEVAQYSLAIKWDAPDCGSVGDYQVELTGVSAPFDIHRQTVTQPHISVTNLLPGTFYSVKVRAVDRSRNVGPWNSEVVEAKTKGDALPISNKVQLLYRTDSELRVSWQPFTDPRLQHYEVTAVEVDDDSRRVERRRVDPALNSFALTGLRPSTKYTIGVIAFVDHEPKQVYQIEAYTTSGGIESWEEKPQVVDQGKQQFAVHWKLPATSITVSKFILEYRLPNETAWRTSEQRGVAEGSGDYSVALSHMNAPYYTVRIVAIDDQNKVVARTEELTVGEAAETSCIGAAGVPTNIRSADVDGQSIRLEWDVPRCDETHTPIDGYEYIVYEASQSAPIDGTSYVGAPHVTLKGLRQHLDYIFKVRSRSVNGHSQWSKDVVIETAVSGSVRADGSAATNTQTVTITQPRIEQSASRSVAYWSVVGDRATVAEYQVDIRSTDERSWRAVEPSVLNEPTQSHYRLALGDLNVASTYLVRVRALDASRSTVATSPSASFSVLCQVPSAPENVRLERVSEQLVRVSWEASRESGDCQSYFFITGQQNGQTINQRVPGNDRSVDISGSSQGDWRVQVRGVNTAGSGTPSRDAIFSSSAQQSLVSTPRVVAQDNDLIVRWKSEGEGRGVYGYHVQFRSENTGWKTYGQLVPYVGDNMEYAQTLTGLERGNAYFIHVQVLDRNSYVMYTSAQSSAKSSCSPPTHTPSHLQVAAPDASHVRVSWALPPQSTWGCSDIQFEIQPEEPRGQPAVVLGSHHTSHIFNSSPNQVWSVKIRAINSAGHSAWTPAAQAKTPPGGELLIGPDVNYRQGKPIISWRSKENTNDLIESFVLEWKSTTEPNWRQHRNPIPYNGWQRPYSVDLGELPKGHTYQVRIVAKDPNRGNAYTSSVVQVQTQSQCKPPRRSPADVQVSPLGPTQIRVQWAPLHESEWNCDRLWYIVKYSSPQNQGFKNLTNGENFVVFDSDPYTQWNFEVQAANPSGESQWSRAQSAQTQGVAPGAVANLRVQPVGSDSLQCSWQPPVNPNGRITQYEVTYQLISRGNCDNNQEEPRTITVNGPHFTITGLHPHSKYRVGVAAKSNVGAGERVSLEIQTDQAAPNGAPLYLRTEEVRPTDVSISWQAPPCLQTNGEITEYEYEVTAGDRRQTVQKTTENIRGTRARIENLQPQTRYNVKVRAYTARGPGPWSTEVPFQTSAGQQNVQAPGFVKVLHTGADNAQLVWQSPYPNPGYVDKYKCRYAPTGTEQYQERQFPAVSPCQQRQLERQNLPQIPPGSRLHCGRIENLKPEQTYDFQVSAHVKDSGWGPYSPPERTKVTDSAVQVLYVRKIGGSENSLHINWDVRPDDKNRVTAFRIVVVPQDGSQRSQTFNVDRATYQYRIDNLRPRTTYNVTVSAATHKEMCGGTSAVMTTDAAALTALSIAPRVIAEEPTSVTIEWESRNREAGGFIVEYRLEGGAWQQYARRVPAHPSQTTYTATVDGLPTNVVVDLRVRVVSQQNEQSNPSPEVRARTKCSPPTSPPQGVRVDAPSTNEVRVSWARPAKNTWMCDQVTVEISYRVGNQPEKVLKVPGDQTEYTFPAEPNQRWVVKLRATNQVGSSQWSPEQSITTRQGAPGSVRDLRVKALSPNEVHVQWLAPLVQRGTIVGYDISYRLKHRLACPEEEPRDVSRDFVTVYNHKDLDYTITGLLPYSLYEVRVRARTTELGPEETKEVSTEQQPPSSPPLNLESTYALERSLSFQWETVDCSQRHGHIVNYEYEILGQDDWAKLERQIANTSDLHVTIDGLTPYTKYVMRVKAYNSIGGGPNTENLVVMTAKAQAPLPPQDLVVAQEGTDFFMVSWLPPYPPYGPHDAYKIRYQQIPTEKWIEVEKGIKDPLLQCPGDSPRFCYNATGLDSGQQFKVQVATRIEGGSYGPWSSLVIANTLQVLPDAPRAIHLIEKTDHSLHIRWIPPVDPKGYVTQYRVSIVSLDDVNDKKRTHIVNHPTLTYLFEDLNPETSYNISISAGTKQGFGREIWTRYTTDPFNIPVVGTMPKVTPDGATALDVQWNAVLDPKNRVKGYIIEIRNSDTPVWQEIGGVTNHDTGRSTYFKKLTGLDSDTLYFVRIKVVDQRQRVGVPSPEAQARTGCAAPLSPPTNLNLGSPSNVQVRVSWQAPNQNSWKCSAIRYKLEYVNGTEGRKQIDLPSSSIEHLFDSKSNTKWTIRIRTENDAGSSEWSKELSITTAEGAPGAVEDLSARPNGPTSIIARWKPPRDPNGVITGYTLTYKLKSIGQCGPRSSTPIEKHVRSEEQTLDGLLPDSTYEIHVVAHTSHAGPQSSVVTVTTEEAAPSGPPLNVRVGSVTSSRADVTWAQPECEQRNGKITDYEYELWSLDTWADNSTGHNPTERLNLDQLIPYTQYQIRVRAINQEGEGPFSEWVPFTTQATNPPAPSGLQEEATFPHSIEISWLPPSPPHGNIDFYKVRYTRTGEANYREIRVETDRLECSDSNKKDRLCYRLSDLDPEQEYDIQVSAHTEGGGWSDWSDELNSRTQQQNIPVLERELEVTDKTSNSISLKWEGLPQDQAAHVVGYVLEFKSEDDGAEWQEYNGVVKHRKSSADYKITVKQLETATLYFFRLRVVGKNEKRGQPGPETKETTSCGKPEAPPDSLKLESLDFETLKITWNPPEESSWRCDNVEYLIDFVNTTSRGNWTVSTDAPSELIVPTQPGTKWDVKIRTQTVEDTGKPQASKWSDRVSITTQSLPGEIFVTVEPKGPKEALVTWELPDKDQKWNYGVDITYRLKQLGGCNEVQTGAKEPVTLLNVQEKQIALEDLQPGSLYEVTVTPRRPPSLHSSIVTPKTIRTFRTKNDVPTGPPQNLQSTVRKDSELGFKWDAPECIQQNGNITQYEFELVGLDEWNEGTREGVTPRQNTLIDQLQPGSLYRIKVRAYTAEGPGPWSDSLEIRTTGSELGPPRELTAVQTKSTQIQLTWLPPYPEKAIVTAYRIRYSPRADDSNPTEVELSGDELTCSGYKSPIITTANLCATIKGLQPSTTYRFAVQGQSSSGNWGEWSSDYFSTTRNDDNELLGGSLKLLSAGHDNLKVKWVPPAVIGEKIDNYDVYISVASVLDQNPKKFEVNGQTTDYHFRHLNSVTQYNVTVQGTSEGNKLWFISSVFSTTDFAEGLLNWLPAPTDLHLIEKSDTMLHVDWVPPEIFDPEQRELITHHRVTIAPFDPTTGKTGPSKNYTVPYPGNSIKFEGLRPETIYNITVQAGTNSGYGHILWGTYSTLAPGQRHILRLLNRTPTTLNVAWEPVWGRAHSGYTLTARTLYSVYGTVRLQQVKTFDVEASETEFVIRGLHPSTVYNVTLTPKDHNEAAWGAYATLPPGWFVVKNLKQCDKTDFAVSMSWEPIELNMASDYQVRYLRVKNSDGSWTEEEARPAKELLCPKDGCGRLCYLVFNLPHNPSEYVFQVRAKVDGEWNHWKSAPKKMASSEPLNIRRSCCIVPPPYFVDNIGAPGTFWEVDVNPAATENNVTRYYVVVDERDPPGDTNWTELTDKVTANKMKIPYYVAASFNLETLPEPRKVRIGDGSVIGGYLNYPLVKGKKYNYEVYTIWNVTGAPLVGRLRASPYITSSWPWWWLLLPLLLALLLTLLCCCIPWCLQRRYRSRKEHSRLVTNGQHAPLLEEQRAGMNENMRQLESRLDKMKGAVDGRARGDFEDGYMKGYKDANKLGSAHAARRRLEDDYGSRDDRFHEGYVKGLKDAGMTGMTTSMHNLAQRTGGGYSAGFAQGYKDGNSGIFGDRVTPSLISRLDEQYAGQEDFKQGYVDGFKEGASSRVGERSRFEDSRRLQQSLTELTERLTSLEKTKGDEIHSTKIYHVYNQQPEGATMTSTGAQLAQELEEIGSSSRRSTLRRHYTPGDYLKQDAEEGYNSLSRNRRSLSASALAANREAAHQSSSYLQTGGTLSRSRHHMSHAGSSYLSRAAQDAQIGGTDTYAKRYNYRSRSDVGSPRRYASQTLLDGSRPGPSAPVSVATNSDETIVELRRQVAHWKSIAEQNANVIASNSEEFITLAELEQRVEALRQQKESEIQAIVESHAESMVEMREMYEEKLSAMQVLPYNASSSTSNADTLDAVLLEKEDLLHKSTRSTNGSDGDERPVVVDLGSHDELVDERIRQMEQELERCKEEREHVLEDLKAQNKELATAYNELNEEFEEFKLRNTQTENANSDLNRRIDSLKANLIEYEERYELCKKENAETVLQLEKLSEDFARLRTGVANVSQKREDCDSMVTEEVEKLRASLDETRLERERLRSDVQKFQVAVGEIDVELEKLREANRQLVGENLALQENLARYDDTMKEIIVSSEEDIGKFREQFNDIQENHRRQREAMTAENQALREETEAVKRQSSIIMEESALLKEVNEKLRQRAANEGAKMELLQKKADLLQQVLEEERAERKREKEEEENKNEEEVDLDEKIDVGENSSEVEKLRKHIQILKLQLREALDANTEKTDECEKLHLETRNLEREVDLRQNCVDEMIAQTNTLQIQQESMSSANKTLQTQILANERQIVQLEEKLREETERNQEMEAKVKRMEEFIVGGCSENEEKSEQEESGSSPAEVAPLKKYIAVLQTRLSEVELELKLIKEQKLDESKEAAEVRQMLERDLFEAEEVDRGLLEGIETRVKEMEDQLNAKVEALEEAKKEKEVLEKKLLELTDRVEKLGETKSQADEFSKQNEKVQNKVAYLTEKESGESSDDADDKNSEIIKDLQESNSHLKARLESALEDNLRLTEEASRIQLSSAELAQQANELLPLREELEQIKGYHAAEVTANEGLQAVVESLQKENENLKLEQSTESKDIEELRTAIAVLQQENEHLKGVAKTQYDENVKYYEQFQAMATHNQQMQDQFTGLQKVSEEIQIKLALEAESHDKKAKELQRLREHLLIVEENSTKEAVESEQRETELRARVRELEAKGHQAEEGATESTQQYQVHIASLTSQIESLQGQSSQWQAKYETEVKAREHTQEALSSLQNVVRELSVDHERDAATASHRNLELQTMIGSLQEEIAQIREELDRQSIGRQAAEEESDRRQLQLHSKQKIIEDLEVQIEELRSPRKPTDSYRIDDATLRQLFLSYFVSDSSKRPDIALLLANILEYPPEEMDKFKSAVRQSFGQSSGGSSFFWGSRASPSSGAPTIADQFVRFLEAESESSHTAPHLPIRQQGQPSPGMSLDSSCQISPNSKSNLATVSSSAAALDSLLR